MTRDPRLSAAAPPSDARTVLLLGGSAEARDLAAALAGRADLRAISRLAGAERRPALHGPAAEPGIAEAIAASGADAVIDATHPCDAAGPAEAARASAARGLPHLRLARPPWQPAPGDRWREVADEAEAAAAIPAGATAFLATGRDRLAAFAASDARLICRRIGPASAFPFPNGRFLTGAPPFAASDEAALFRDLGVDLLVVRNAGGPGGWPKLAAARALGLPVLMIARPPPPPGAALATSVAAALDWLSDRR